jgi:hypothetical protein
MKIKKTNDIYDKRIKLIDKYVGSNKKPSTKELQEAYGYLDYCIYCEKPITFFNRLTFNVAHCMLGNSHRWCP